MLSNQTVEKLTELRLHSMTKELKKQIKDPHINNLSFDDRIGLIVDAEWNAKHNTRINNILKVAGLRQQACLEDIDFDSERRIKRDLISQLSTGLWIKEGQNLIVTGATGTGKSYITCAFGNYACRSGIKAKYYRVNRFLTDLTIARGDGSYNKLLLQLKKIDVLILDDFGMSVLDPVLGRDLLEVIEDRYKIRSTIISSQLPVSDWHNIFEDSTVADAVLDRLVHDSYRIELFGDSMREKYARLSR